MQPSEADVERSKAALRLQLQAGRVDSAATGGPGYEPPSGPGLVAVARALRPVVETRRVALYVSMGTEPDTRPLIEWLICSGADVLLPVLYDDNDLGWGLAPGPGRVGLVPGRLGLMIPPVDLGVDAIATADLVICPALAVDRTGVRLGRGGGSYDRALSRVPAGTPIWAAVHDHEIIDSLPSAPHDHRVDGALTPTGFLPLAS